jgi:hypothetical protein
VNDLLPVLLVIVAGALLASLCSRGFSARERKWVAAALVMHVAFACAQVLVTVDFYGHGDMLSYFGYGELLARMMERDPLRVIPEVTALLLHKPYRLPLAITGAGSSTGSMTALGAWSFYLLGPSKYATCIVFAMWSLSGKIAMYRVFRANLDPAFRFTAAVATLFVPSFVFWSAGLVKEAVAVGGFGWSLLGAHLWIREDRPVSGLALLVAGAFPVLLIKPYILFPFALAGGSWLYWARSIKQGRFRVRPVYFVAAGILGIGGIVLLGHYFPQYALESLTTRTAELQQIGRTHRGGSSYELGSEIPTTLAGQFAYAPAALASSLFRPAFFEVHNVLMLANALETTALTLLFAYILLRRNVGSIRRQVAGQPFLVFCVVFVMAFGIAVGLASSNLGTLSRYRSPLLPFFVVLLLVLRRPLRVQLPGQDARAGPRRVAGAS